MGFLSSSLHFLLLLFIFCSQVFCSLLSPSSSHSSAVPQCHLDERYALLQLKRYFSMDADSYCDVAKTTFWNESTNCCTWGGIKCDNVTGHVIGLDLFCARLRGTISSNSSLFFLRHLQMLDLSFNDFRGSSILPEFGQFRNMTHLNLDVSNFSGNIPLEISRLSKLISFQLTAIRENKIRMGEATFKALAQNLTNLRRLYLFGVDMSAVPLVSLANLSSSMLTLGLGSCQLHGELPKNVFHFPKLKDLYLEGNNLNGLFPWSSLNLEQLVSLNLSRNKFSGQLPQVYHNASHNFSSPTSSKNSVSASSSSLILIELSSNFLSGTIPTWVYELSSLQSLGLNNNLFSGALEDFHSTSLSFLSLSRNRLQGVIPQSIFQNLKLNHLDLSSNNFTGSLELEKLSKLKELELLDLSSNNLSLSFNSSINHTFENLLLLGLSSCKLREFPNFLRFSKRLDILDLSHNQMQGSLPKWLGKDSLSVLNLSHNFLTHIDQSLSLKVLKVLDLHSNLFSGRLPTFSSPFLMFYFASRNQFTGAIPTSICKFISLRLLDLSDNHFTGNIPECMGYFSQHLILLNLQRNKLRGIIPGTFSKRNNLRNLILNRNELEGPLPRSLVYCRRLEVLDLGNNLLNDTFPDWLESLPELRILVLRANKFRGHIGTPESNFPFRELRIIDLSDNDFSGALPVKYFENFKAMMNAEKIKMTYMGDGYYLGSVLVTIKGLFVELGKIQTIMTTIDFSRNKFSGEIPEFIGQLKSLKGLNLSHNMLNSTIPTSLGNLTNLEWLDLSSNELVREIPLELSDIPWLAFLNLSHNHLEGPIPQGKQFNTFGNDCFVDNLDLCGFPLSKPCSEDGNVKPLPPTLENDDTNVFNWKVVLMGYGSGFIIGISIGYVLLYPGEEIMWKQQHPSARRSRKETLAASRGDQDEKKDDGMKNRKVNVFIFVCY